MLDASRGWLNTAIALAAFAGLRQGEVRALEVRDVDLRAGIITIRRAFSEGEFVPVAPRLAELVGPALSGKLPAARVVVNRRGETPSRRAVNLEAVRELAGHSKLLATQRYVPATGADLHARHFPTLGNWWETAARLISTSRITNFKRQKWSRRADSLAAPYKGRSFRRN